MTLRTSYRITAVGAALALVTACTMKKQEAPPLSGPSEFAKSVGISVTPDVLTQDGASQSLIDVSVRDANAAPVRNQSLRAEINVAGVAADFGSLSARNLVTDANGHATAVYTAPAAPAIAVDNGTIVDIVITPVGCPSSQQCVGDFNNSTSRTASIRLVPPGSVAPPDGLKPSFTFTPTAPVDSQTVLFDASASTSAAGNPIVSYSWSFGDGGRGSGVTAGHAYTTAGSYVVTLTVADAYGRTAQKSANIIVAAGVNPTAAFSSSPSDPVINQAVNFNASATRAAPGRSIKAYEWDFGDGTFGSGVTTSHGYGLARSYVVVLTVTDDSGKKGTATGTVTVK
jgi:PKD repeat protein